MRKVILTYMLAAFAFYVTSGQDTTKPRAVLNHQALYVQNLDRAAGFYKNIIGLEPIEEPFKIGKHVWLKTGAHTSLHLIAGAPARKEYYKNHHLCFSVPDLDIFIHTLQKNKLEWEDGGGKKNAVTTRPDGIKQLWIQDPDGYWLEINNDQQGF